MSESIEPVIQTCTACGALIDVSDEEPFALMHCATCGTAQRVRRQFDHFELLETLGTGGMGAVYRALDTSLNRPVALKLLRQEYSADQEFVRQFEKEAAITASINHPNVVKVYSAGQDHGLVYIAMELVDKGSLDDLMNLQVRVAEAQVLEVGIQMAKGLNAALQRGLIHRDVKPGNILFANAHTAKIVDFGLAVLQEHASTVAGEVWGTPYYVAPEKLDQQPEDFRSDIYSLGATLFHALAGRPPFEAETASMVALKHLKSQAVSLQAFAPDVTSATAYVINKTLAKEPNDRYQSYEELIEHLEYARNELLAATAKGPAPKARVVLEDAGSAKAMGWVTLAMIVIIVAIGVVAYMKRDAFKKSEPQIAPQVKEAVEEKSRVEQKFKEAREMLVAGKFEEAAASFQELAASPNVPQPLLNWLTLHHGLALLLAGKEPEARPVFAEIESRGKISPDVVSEKMANFFVDTARLLAAEKRIKAEAAVRYSKDNYEAIALFLYALKDWDMGHIEDAGPLFRQFNSSKPKDEYAYFEDYKGLSNQYVDAFTKARKVAEQLRAADTIEKKKEAVEDAKTTLEKIELKGKLTEQLGEEIKQVEESIAAFEKEQSEKMAAEQEADSKALPEMRAQASKLALQLKFAEARAVVLAAPLQSEKAKREQAALIKKIDWLAKFKATLIADINAAPYPNQIARKNGQLLAGAPTRANDLGVQVSTPFGATSSLWTDVSLESMFTMARYYIKPGVPAEVAADRQWTCGVFAFFAGKQREGRELLVQASQGRAQYKEELPLFLEFAEAH